MNKRIFRSNYIFIFLSITLLLMFIELSLTIFIHYKFKHLNPKYNNYSALSSIFILQKVVEVISDKYENINIKQVINDEKKINFKNKVVINELINPIERWQKYEKVHFKDFKSMLFDDKNKIIFEKIYYPRKIEAVRKTVETYHNNVFTWRPNTLDYLVTERPEKILSNQSDYLINKNNYGRISYTNKAKKECWLFGGSTVWGENIESQFTVVSWLNKLQNDFNFINYGVPGYNSNSQLSYLIYLLKKRKIKPKCVIWLDGLNDATFTTYRPAVNAYDRSSHFDRDQSDFQVYKNLSNYQISKTKILQRDKETMNLIEDLKKYDLKSFKIINASLSLDLMSKKINLMKNNNFVYEAVNNHIKNAKMVKNLLNEKSTNKPMFFWFIQPNGELLETNPFLLKSHFNSGRYNIQKLYFEIILKNSKNFSYDITHLHNDCKTCYVDVCHYSNQFSKIIALSILKVILNNSS